MVSIQLYKLTEQKITLAITRKRMIDPEPVVL